MAQQFSYDAHDKLTGGLNESEGYDANGNLLSQTVGAQTTTFTWDDEDRLVSQQFPDGHSDSYTYTGLGMRLSKSDPTGPFSYLADGVSPASPVLTDGRTSFTPGISEYSGSLGSRFYVADAQGNGRGLLDASQSAQDGYNWDGFGNLVSRFGNNPTGYAWNEEAGYQTDGDSGLKLLGHRYYDSRTGRFISQDPAGSGNNWYAYADNDPMDEADPSGLSSSFDPSKAGTAPGGGPSAWGDYNSGDPGTYDFFSGGTYTHSETISEALNAAFTSTSGPMMGAGPAGMGGGRGGSGRFASGEMTLPPNPSGLPAGWGGNDTSHKYPNGSRHWGPNGQGLDFHKGTAGKPKWGGKDHWHKLKVDENGKVETDTSVGDNGHLSPGEKVGWAVVGTAVLWGAWETVKWGGAILAAPETAGLSLGAAALVP